MKQISILTITLPILLWAGQSYAKFYCLTVDQIAEVQRIVCQDICQRDPASRKANVCLFVTSNNVGCSDIVSDRACRVKYQAASAGWNC